MSKIEMDDGMFAEATKWRELAREMRQIIAKVSCSCVDEDEAEREWLATLSTETRQSLNYSEPVECPRCQALDRYDAVAGSDVVLYELPVSPPTDEQTVRLFNKLKQMGIIEEEDN